jgi:hypothetical protein
MIQQAWFHKEGARCVGSHGLDEVVYASNPVLIRSGLSHKKAFKILNLRIHPKKALKAPVESSATQVFYKQVVVALEREKCMI